MKKLLDLQHPFFRPMPRRIATFALIMAWGGLEAWWGNGTWAMLFWALGLYCGFQFFFGDPPRDPAPEKEDP